jgi:hypothetical protein
LYRTVNHHPSTDVSSIDIGATTSRLATPRSANSEPILRYLTVAGLALLALIVTLEPDVGFAAPLPIELMFWALQISCGLLVLQSLLYLLTRRFGASRVPSWCWVLLSGVLGAVVLAPLYWLIGEGLIQGWYGTPGQPDDENISLIGVALTHPLLKEYMDIVGPVTAAWALICLPRLHWLMPPLLHERRVYGVQDLPFVGGSAENAARLTVPVNRAGPLVSGDYTQSPGAEPALHEPSLSLDTGHLNESAIPAAAAWHERLPAALGTDVIAVTSELQYLRVWTPRGCALILGALADVEAEAGETGLRVHRSWWVATEHVVTVRRTASAAVCVMSDGRQVPVSRRRRSEVLARFGEGVRYRVGGASKAAADTDLD